jgi:hypothetical protein
MYKYHFNISKLHLAVGAGVDLKFPVMNDVNLRYQKTDLDETYSNITFNYANADHVLAAEGLSMHIAPKAGVDIYLGRWLMLSLQYYRSPLTNGGSDGAITGFGLAKMTYLVSMGKDDRIRSLQQYKD